MLNPQIQIIPFQEQFQQEINLLMESNSKEFLEPISNNRITKSILTPDLYLVAFLENKVIGTISITKHKNNNSVLRKMFLHKNYRGQGIAEFRLRWQPQHSQAPNSPTHKRLSLVFNQPTNK
jgi:Acetyltransferase (GNAT) domain